MFHKEGAKFIFFSLLIAVAVIVGVEYIIDIPWIIKSVQILTLLFLVIILQFFRNPNRALNDIADHFILAPVDGKVVVTEEVYEPEYFKDNRLMASIVMSPINVYVTRYALN